MDTTNRSLFSIRGFSLAPLLFSLCLSSTASAAELSAVDTVSLDLSGLPFEERLNLLSRHLLGSHYLLSPLGEGSGIDPDPTLRLDAFDCTTYIETVIAYSRASAQHRALETLTSIRYSNGEIGFGKRRHLPEFQWLPELISTGILKDITSEIGGLSTAYLHKSISPQIWQKQTVPVVSGLTAKAIPTRHIALPYIPLNKLDPVLSRINEIAVINVVRINRDNYPIVITHQALLIPGKQGHSVRHARAHPVGRVIEEPAEKFFSRLQRYQRWPVAGINFADIVAPELETEEIAL